MQPPQKQFEWKNKPNEKVKKSLVPSANFRSRLVHPLTHINKKPAVLLSESRATSLDGPFLAGSLESLAYEDKLIEETSEKDILGKMHDDKEYLEFLLGYEGKYSTVKLDNLGLVPGFKFQETAFTNYNAEIFVLDIRFTRIKQEKRLKSSATLSFHMLALCKTSKYIPLFD